MPGPVDAVLHFASPASPVDYLELPIQTLKVGSLGTHNSLGLAKAKGARFLLASTSEVYGDPQVHPQPETYWGNVNPIGPRGVYDEAKRFAEAMTMAYHRSHGLDVRIARIFNIYGPRMRPGDGRVVSNFLVQALRGEPLTIYGDGSQTRSFCFVDDEIEGFLALLDGDATGPLNIGNPGEFTVARAGRPGAGGHRIGLADRVRGPAGGRSPPAQAGPDPHPPELGWQPKIEPARGPGANGGLLPQRWPTSRPEPGRAGSGSGSGGPGHGLVAVAQVPVEGAAQAVVEVGDGLEAELLLGPAGVDAPAGLPVGLGGVPAHLALEADQVADDGDQLADGQLAVGAQVGGLASVVVLGGQHDARGRRRPRRGTRGWPRRCPTRRCGRHPTPWRRPWS